MVCYRGTAWNSIALLSYECAFSVPQLALALPGLMPTSASDGLSRLDLPSDLDLASRRRSLVEDLLLATGGRGSVKLTHVMRQVGIYCPSE